MSKPTSKLNVGLILAITLIITSKRLQKHTGIKSGEWLKELLDQIVNK